MAMLIRHTRLNVTSIYPRINPAYVELACEPAPAKPCRLAQFSGAPRGTGGISGNCRSPPVGFIGPLIAITLGIVGLVLDKYCIGIRVSNEVYSLTRDTVSIVEADIGNRHHRYPAFFGAPMSTGMISCNSQSLPVGIIGPQITANASIVASWFYWIAF